MSWVGLFRAVPHRPLCGNRQCGQTLLANKENTKPTSAISINGMAVCQQAIWPTSYTILLADVGRQCWSRFFTSETAGHCRLIDKMSEWRPTLLATSNGPCGAALTLFTLLPRPFCEWNICFVICESSSRKRLMSNRSVSGTSQVEMLPDVVPDQRRLIEEESTEVGAVCISFHNHFYIFCFVTF